MDGSRYEEHDILLVKAMIQAETVEGRGPRSGRIKYLAMLFSEAETIQKLSDNARKTAETAGSITSGASKTSFEQHLESGHTCWALKSLQDGWNRQSLSVFCGNSMRYQAESLVTA